MGAPLNNASAFEHQNLIGPQNRGEPMRDNETRAMRHQVFQCLLNQPFRRRIYAGRRFIENQNRRIF